MIISSLIQHLRYNLPWSYKHGNITGKAIYFHFTRFCKNGIFEMVYRKLINKYLSHNRKRKTKYLLIDSSMILNINGTIKAKRNPIFKSKKVTKLSTVTDINGISLSLLMENGTDHDRKIALKHVDSYFLKKIVKSDTCCVLGDAGYDSKKLKDKLEENNLTHMIYKNPRNRKNKNINKLDNKEKRIYAKRIRVDRLEDMFMGFVYIAASMIIMRK